MPTPRTSTAEIRIDVLSQSHWEPRPRNWSHEGHHVQGMPGSGERIERERCQHEIDSGRHEEHLYEFEVSTLTEREAPDHEQHAQQSSRHESWWICKINELRQGTAQPAGDVSALRKPDREPIPHCIAAEAGVEQRRGKQPDEHSREDRQQPMQHSPVKRRALTAPAQLLKQAHAANGGDADHRAVVREYRQRHQDSVTRETSTLPTPSIIEHEPQCTRE